MKKLPPELRELAGQNTDMARLLFGGFKDSYGRATDAAGGVEDAYTEGANALDPAIRRALQRARDGSAEYETGYSPGINQTLQEILASGSDARQNEEAALARNEMTRESAAALEGMGRRQARHGLSVGAGADNAQTALQVAANTAAAANAARYTERERGEAIRRQILPNFQSQAEQMAMRYAMPALFREQQAGLRGKAGTALPMLLAPSVGIGEGAAAQGNLAYQKHNDIYNMENVIRNHNSARKGNMLETGLNIGSKVFSAMTGIPVPPMGTTLRGGGGGSFDMSSFLSSFGGGGTGLGSTAGGGYGGQSTGRHSSRNGQYMMGGGSSGQGFNPMTFLSKFGGG